MCIYVYLPYRVFCVVNFSVLTWSRRWSEPEKNINIFRGALCRGIFCHSSSTSLGSLFFLDNGVVLALPLVSLSLSLEGASSPKERKTEGFLLLVSKCPLLLLLLLLEG